MRALLLLFALAPFVVGCADTKYMMQDDEDLSWGPAIEDDYEVVMARARTMVVQEYPLGIDPDLSKEEEGDFWSIWRIDLSVMYRETVRRRVRVKVEDLGKGKVRVGVAIVEQINDNIDEPSSIKKAKWVRKHRLPEDEMKLRERIERTTRKFEASAKWKEKHRSERRTGLRPDLVDWTDDVTLEDYKSSNIVDVPKIAGQSEYGGGQTEYGKHTRKKKEDEKDGK